MRPGPLNELNVSVMNAGLNNDEFMLLTKAGLLLIVQGLIVNGPANTSVAPAVRVRQRAQLLMIVLGTPVAPRLSMPLPTSTVPVWLLTPPPSVKVPAVINAVPGLDGLWKKPRLLKVYVLPIAVNV